MVSFGLTLAFLSVTGVSASAGSTAANNKWDWGAMTEKREFSGDSQNSFQHFDSTYMMALIGENGRDSPILHKSYAPPKVALTSMEKVTSMTAVSTRASIRSQLVGLLKAQVRIESMYGTKKEKLYLAASAIYGFIAKLLHSACDIALSNDVLWKEQMECFGAYRQLLEVYAMWNGVRDVAFALEHGMAVSDETLAMCGDTVSLQEHFVSQTSESNRLQNQYLVAATERACLDYLQVQIESRKNFMTEKLISTDPAQDRAQACLFRVITVLTCLASGNQEAILDLAIREEHKQHVVFSLARYASVALHDAEEAGAGQLEANNNHNNNPETESESDSVASAASFVQLRDARPFGGK